jgi:hypothetical protein
MIWLGCRRWRGPACALAVFAMAGCSTMGGLTKDSPPEEKQAVVKERANARWAALIKGDIDTAYAYSSPASRKAVSIESFAGRRGAAKYTAATVESVTCEAEACQVEIKLTYDYPVMRGKVAKGIQTPLTETWVLDNGTAWMVLR